MANQAGWTRRLGVFLHAIVLAATMLGAASIVLAQATPIDVPKKTRLQDCPSPCTGRIRCANNKLSCCCRVAGIQTCSCATVHDCPDSSVKPCP